MFQSTTVLISGLLTSILSSVYLGKTNLLPSIQLGMKESHSFGAIIILQALFGGNGLTDTPIALKNFFKKPLVKFMLLFLIAFGGTQDIERSFLLVVAFLFLMQLLRNEEERKKHKYLI